MVNAPCLGDDCVDETNNAIEILATRALGLRLETAAVNAHYMSMLMASTAIRCVGSGASAISRASSVRPVAS